MEHNRIEPIISIGMPVFNCERTLRRSIRSILNQTFSNWELLIVDDGSTDNTTEIAQGFKDPRIAVIRGEKRQGLGGRLNQAIDLSRGQYFARMDGDDVAYPNRLEIQLNYLRKHPDVDVLAAGVLVFKGRGHVIGKHRIAELHEKICRSPWRGFDFAHVTWMGPIAWFRRHKYDSSSIRSQDYDLLLRSFESSRFASIRDILVGVREETFSLHKQFASRFYCLKSLIAYVLSKRKWSWLFYGIVSQVARAGLDTIAIVTGLNHAILRHRALPVDQSTVTAWSKLWSEVNP